MFDLGFSELVVIAIVALVVLGPERLPKATRFVGVWVRRARSQWSSVKDELERDMASDELKRQLNEARSAFSDTRQSLRESADEARAEFEQMRAAVAPEDEALPANEQPLGDEQMEGRLESGDLAMGDESLEEPRADTKAPEAENEREPADGQEQPLDHEEMDGRLESGDLPMGDESEERYPYQYAEAPEADPDADPDADAGQAIGTGPAATGARNRAQGDAAMERKEHQASAADDRRTDDEKRKH